MYESYPNPVILQGVSGFFFGLFADVEDAVVRPIMYALLWRHGGFEDICPVRGATVMEMVALDGRGLAVEMLPPVRTMALSEFA